MKALVDLDLVVYRVGCACDNWYYEYNGVEYESSKLLKSYLKRETGDDVMAAEMYNQAIKKRKPEAWEDVRDSVVSFVEDLIEPYQEYEGYITGKGNFRFEIATILPYKGNRDDSVRPFYYDEIRQLLVDAYGAKMSEGMEADDCLGLASKSGTIILSVDKDLDQIPGWHYNWERDKKYFITEQEGAKVFYKQMLTGDMTDNILGLYGVGPKSALLSNIDKMDDEVEIRYYIKQQYESRFGAYGIPFLLENAKLLWVLQERENPFTWEDYWK